MIDLSLYKSISGIPLPNTPNNAFSIVLNGLTFDIEFRCLGEKMIIYIQLGDVVLVNGGQICLNLPMNLTSQHSYSGGHFWFEGEVEPKFENFSRLRFYFGSF